MCRQALWSTPGEGERLGLELAEAAYRVEDQCCFWCRRQGEEGTLWSPLWGQNGLETSSNSSFSHRPWDSNGSKILRFHSDLLKHEVELRGAGSWGPFWAKGQKVTITQFQPVTPWQSDIVD